MLASRSVCAAVALVLALAVVSCDDTTKPGPVGPIDSPAHLVDALAITYWTRDYDRFAPLLAREPDAEFRFSMQEPLEDGTTSWTSASELLLHRRMFRPDAVEPGELPVDAQIRLRSVDIQMQSLHEFTERPELLRSPENPQGLDPLRWKAWGDEYSCRVVFETLGSLSYLVTTPQGFVVLEDLQKQVGDEGKFLLYRWSELRSVEAVPAAAAAAASRLWGQVKHLYAQASPIVSEAAAIQEFADAYRQRSYGRFAPLLSHEAGAEYLFILDQSDPSTGETHWGRAEELRIQHRMFAPESIPPGDPPVHVELWLASIELQLTQQTPFTERTDLYRSDMNPAGLDPNRWRAREAVYGTNVLFDTQGDLDYRVDGRADFIVIEDRDRLSGTPGKFFLYRWEDLGSYAAAPGNRRESPLVAPGSWSSVKALYR